MNDIEQFVNKFGLTPFWSVVFILLIICIWQYDRVRVILTDIYCIAAKTIGWFKREATKRKLEEICNKGFTSISQEISELNLPNLKINWIAKGTQDITLKDKEAIVFLKFNPDNTQNIINATSAYVKKTLLPIPKTYMSPQVRDAIDYTVIRKCLLEIPEYRLAVTDFIKNSQDICIENQSIIDKVCNIDDAGLMSRILFREYFEWGNRIAGRNIDNKYQKEASEFLDFLYDITARRYDDNTRLQYISENIKVGVLLVAKLDTFSALGETPYVRRIKEGFAKGIRTFYLLARNEKLDIVEDVYGKLIQTGNYNLLNGPKAYKDAQGRENICYCIEINSEGNMAQTFNRLSNAMDKNAKLEAVVHSVYADKILCLINDVKIIIPYNKITDVPDLKLHYYFQVGMSIEFIPVEYDKHGNVLGSLLQTNSNPQRMMDNKFCVGKEVEAIVEQALDDCLFLRIKDSDIKAVALRKDITYSHYIFLHQQFPVGNEYLFRIIEIDYISNRLYLQLANLRDPWENLKYSEGQKLICTVYQKKESCVITEIEEGVKAILPFTETTWFTPEPSQIKKFKNNVEFNCRIKSINQDRRLVILTTKSKESPYLNYYKRIEEDKYIVDAQVIASDAKGLVCLADEKYRIFIPQSETHIGVNKYKCKIKDLIKVHINDISNDKRSFIGSLKPFIKHPMQWFADNYAPGIALSNLTINTINEKSVLFNIHRNPKQYCLGLLPIGEVTNLCHIESMERIYKDGIKFPLIITEIDMERCIVKLSLKKLLANNKDKVKLLDYYTRYSAYIIGKRDNDCIIIVDKIWIEGILIESKNCKIGDKVSVRAISLGETSEFSMD